MAIDIECCQLGCDVSICCVHNYRGSPTYTKITNTVSTNTDFGLCTHQWRKIALSESISTVPLARISCNTVFSKSQNARKAGTLCNGFNSCGYFQTKNRTSQELGVVNNRNHIFGFLPKLILNLKLSVTFGSTSKLFETSLFKLWSLFYIKIQCLNLNLKLKVQSIVLEVTKLSDENL